MGGVNVINGLLAFMLCADYVFQVGGGFLKARLQIVKYSEP
jgi:hypothetical protein